MPEVDPPLTRLLPDHPRIRALVDRPAIALAVRLGSILLAYAVLERWVLSAARLPASSYEGPLIALEVARSFLVQPSLTRSYALRVGALVGLLSAIALYPRHFWARWADLEGGSVLRVMVAVPTLVLAWALSTYAYNAYFDQSHLLDRVGLLALGVLVLWRPVFTLPFAMAAVAIVWQFNHPLTPYSVAEQFLLVRFLLVFFAFFLLRTLLGRHRSSDFAFVAFTLVGASFFEGGLGKLELGWFSHGEVGLLLPATYANGWLGFLDPSTVGAVTSRLLYVDPLLTAGTFVLECGAILCLLRRPLLQLFLASWIVFHFAIFALSGIFFWKWVLLEVALLGLMTFRRSSPVFAVFTRPHAWASIPLIVGGTVWFAPVDLSWYNSPVSYTYEFAAVTEDGRTSRLPPEYFAPYDYQFTQSGFRYLSPYRQLQVVWGAAFDRDVVDALLAADEVGDVARIEQDHGELFHDESRAERLDEFLGRFVGAINERGPGGNVLGVLRAPPQLWSFAGPDTFDGDARIARIRVSRITSFYADGRYVELDPREIRTIEIAPPAEGAW